MEIAERFWVKVDKSDECWNWLAATNEWGYGVFKFHGNMRRAHRVAWELTNGSIPSLLCVCHRCDNPRCVRPSHLFLGTLADNAKDMTAKSRNVGFGQQRQPVSSRGERRPNAKLTNAQAAEIRELGLSGKHTQDELAQLYGVHQTRISAIVNGRAY